MDLNCVDIDDGKIGVLLGTGDGARRLLSGSGEAMLGVSIGRENGSPCFDGTGGSDGKFFTLAELGLNCDGANILFLVKLGFDIKFRSVFRI